MVPQPEDEGLEKALTLTARLERGPLPLSAAVRYSYDIAKALRELHRKGKTHGAVTGRVIELRTSGAVLLLPAGGLLPESAFRQDIQSFGWILRSVFPNVPPPSPPGASTPEPPSPDVPASKTSSQAVWKAARRLTDRCLADPPEPDWTMQKVVSDLRLLDLVARQWERKARFQPAASTPTPKIWRQSATPVERQVSPLPLEPAPAPPPPAQAAVPSSAVEFQTSPAEPRTSGIRCPRCSAPYVHPSNPRTDFEETLELWNMPVLRCHRCSFRYFRLLGMAIPKGAEE